MVKTYHNFRLRVKIILFDFEGQNQLGNSVEGTGPPVDTDGRGLFYQPNSGYPQKSPSTDLIHHFNYPNSKNFENVPFVYERNENEAVTSGRPAQHQVRSNLPGIAQNSENMGIRVQSHQITPEYRQPYQSNGNFNGGLASQTNFNAPPYKVPYQDMGRSAAIETVRGMFNNQTLNDRGSVYPMQRHTPSYDYDYSQSNRGGTYNHEERNYISQEERQNYWENPVRNVFNYRNDESNHRTYGSYTDMDTNFQTRHHYTMENPPFDRNSMQPGMDPNHQVRENRTPTLQRNAGYGFNGPEIQQRVQNFPQQGGRSRQGFNKIKPPVFDGSYEEWPYFKRLFLEAFKSK